MSVDLCDITNARNFLHHLIEEGEVKAPSSETIRHRHLWILIRFLQKLWLEGFNIPFGVARTQVACRIGDTRLKEGEWLLAVEGAEGWAGSSFYLFKENLPYLGTFPDDYANVQVKYSYAKAYANLINNEKDRTTKGSPLPKADEEGV